MEAMRIKNFREIELSPVPLYAQIKERLRERILDGSYQPHAQFPSENEIGAIFNVSRITVRQALSDLEREGVIFRIPGKGTFVSKSKAYQQLNQLEGFAEAMGRLGHDIFNHVTSHLTVPASQAVAHALKLEAEAAVTEIRRIRHLDGKPLSVELTYLSADIGERLKKENLATRDIFLILENDYGLSLGHADLKIDAISADKNLAADLQLAEGAALLRIERLTHTADGKPLDFEYLYFRGDAFQYRMQVARRNGASLNN
jgi:GntR family transcriptional regulator